MQKTCSPGGKLGDAWSRTKSRSFLVDDFSVSCVQVIILYLSATRCNCASSNLWMTFCNIALLVIMRYGGVEESSPYQSQLSWNPVTCIFHPAFCHAGRRPLFKLYCLCDAKKSKKQLSASVQASSWRRGGSEQTKQWGWDDLCAMHQEQHHMHAGRC